MSNSILQTRYQDPMTTPLGRLQVGVFDVNIGMPVPNATIKVKERGSDKTVEELITNDSGQSAIIDLQCPPLDYSLSPDQPKPYSEYTLEVTAPDFDSVKIEGVEIFSDTTALQNVTLLPVSSGENALENISIGEHTLWATYPPKIPEEDVKQLNPESGFVVLDNPVVPEFVVVHDGLPTDKNAPNYYVKFSDYVKNVASSEIYTTWPDATITANIIAIISFTLNRVYTEWYRNKGYNFTITSSTAFDHAFFYGRNIFQEISTIVDNIFNTYVTRSGIRQPLFTQYCDGIKSVCPNWMSQWGSKALGDQGYSYLDILKRYYGQDIYLLTANKVSGVPSSYPGYALQLGSRGKDVVSIQTQLNAIANNYPSIKKVAADGVFGEQTRQAVQAFQTIFHLVADGIVGFSTWYKISDVYVAVEKLAAGAPR